jgi:uncharacterized membrane protein YhaH (DUF805 family)
MIKFWLIAYFYFIISTYIVEINFEIKQRRNQNEFGDLGMEGLFIGVFYLCSFGVTVVIMLITLIGISFKN